MEARTLQQIKLYLQRVKYLFVTGWVRLVAEFWIIKITYKSSFVDFVVKQEIDGDDKEAIHRVVDFCFDAYFDYERHNQPLTSDDLGTLLNVSSWQARWILNKIYKKLRIYGEPVLQEEQEIKVIHHRKQKPAGSLISKESCSRNLRKKKERTEAPLW